MLVRFRKTGLSLCVAGIFHVVSVNSAEWAIESDINARAEYNDNLFLVPNPEDGIWSLKITPEVKMLVRESNWESNIELRLRSNNYSDEVVDSIDKFFFANASYQSERNIYSINGEYSLISNLNRESPDFSIATRQVQRQTAYITPAYTRLLTERLLFAASYNHTDVDFIDAENTGYVPYTTDSLSGSLRYDLTERDNVSFVVQAVDYSSKDESLEYQLFVTRLGITHEFTELWSADFSIGGSRRNSSNRTTQTFDFFGQPVTLTEVTDFSDTGYVLDTGFTRKMESGSISGRISRDNVPNSFGGLNEVNVLKFKYSHSLTELLRYVIDARYEDVDAVSTVTRSTDREVLFFGGGIFYTIDRHWTASVSYRYIQRKFKSDTSDDRAPHSNLIYIGMTYNFPDISTF